MVRAIALGGRIEPPKPCRPLPSGCEEYLELAIRLGLSCPLGRALYATNRRVNGWPHGVDVERMLRRAREETALRWLAHWESGGHIRSLGHSQEDWNKQQAERRREYNARIHALYGMKHVPVSTGEKESKPNE